jgi:hypothetical protein
MPWCQGSGAATPTSALRAARTRVLVPLSKEREAEIRILVNRELGRECLDAAHQIASQATDQHALQLLRAVFSLHLLAPGRQPEVVQVLEQVLAAEPLPLSRIQPDTGAEQTAFDVERPRPARLRPSEDAVPAGAETRALIRLGPDRILVDRAQGSALLKRGDRRHLHPEPVTARAPLGQAQEPGYRRRALQRAEARSSTLGALVRGRHPLILALREARQQHRENHRLRQPSAGREPTAE